ncbi:uncharacterized protein [Argopecten irradians]|uniref:uncharacterized protein n=1 Tax=Argopecten irradians TaxID=31199 RepID=UPI0037143BA1
MAAQTPVVGCSEHPGMGFVYVCKTCNNDLICTNCVVDNHNKHDLGILSEYVKEQKHTIHKYEEQLLKIEIPKLESCIKEEDESFKENRKDIEKMIEAVKIQGERMKKKIDQLTETLVKFCRDLERMNEDIFVRNKTKLTKRLQEEVRPQQDRCHQVITSGTNDDVITLARETRNTKCSSSVPIDLGTLKTATFKPGTIQNGLLERMLGMVSINQDDPVFQPTPNAAAVSTFKAIFPYELCRVCRSGDRALLSSWDEDHIVSIDKKGNTEKIECKVKVHSMAVSPTTGRVWFCVKNDKSIREITSDGEIVKRFNVTCVPSSLVITREDMVVVGLAFNGIVMYTADGRMVTDGAGRVCRQEAALPHHMAYSTTTGDVAVADTDYVTLDTYMTGSKPGEQPLVIVMDKHLKLKFQCRYIGGMESQTGDSQQSRFYPWDVCFDGAGDVLVAEEVTRSVLLIDGNTGQFLRTVYISDGEVPFSISRKDDSTLWIGHKDHEIKIINFV